MAYSERRTAENYSEQWGVYDYQDDDGTIHVAPLFGRRHDMRDCCWCHPERNPDDRMVVVHNVEH